MTSGKPMAYPKRTTQLHSGMTCLFCPAPNKLLTSEPVVAASELTMTKNTVETLRMTLVCQFHFSQMLDSYEESKPRGHSDKRMEHTPNGHPATRQDDDTSTNPAPILDGDRQGAGMPDIFDSIRRFCGCQTFVQFYGMRCCKGKKNSRNAGGTCVTGVIRFRDGRYSF